MSAYIVNHDHIDALLSFAVEHQIRYVVAETRSCVEIELHSATEVGRILLTENERSVRSRYPDCDVSDLPGTVGEDAATYKFKKWPARHPLSAMAILKACGGFDYQACESEDYEQSLAATIIRAIRQYAINRLPGYSASEGWHLCRPVKA